MQTVFRRNGTFITVFNSNTVFLDLTKKIIHQILSVYCVRVTVRFSVHTLQHGIGEVVVLLVTCWDSHSKLDVNNSVSGFNFVLFFK